jgi:hypothetical protein
MKVIGAGFGRTGTSSLQSALEEILGGKCYHMMTISRRPDHLKVWHDFALGKRPAMDWKWLFKDYVACVDFPVCMFYGELMETFPDAKVILTVRDPQSWWKSFNLLMSIMDKARWLRFFGTNLRRTIEFSDKIVTQDVFGGRLEKENCIDIFERHNQEVRVRVPKERLLEYDVKQGWEPLCEFLKVPIPGKKKFPHLNAGGKTLRKLYRQTVLKDLLRR